MCVYELLWILEGNGFEPLVCYTTQQKKDIKKLAYTPNESAKHYWIDGFEVSKLYLQCILQADGLKKDIPHFAPNDVYKLILDPMWKPVTKQRAIQWAGQDDNWDAERTLAIKNKRAPGPLALPPSKVAKRPLALPWDGEGSDVEDYFSDALSSASSTSSSSNSSTSSSCNSSSQASNSDAGPARNPDNKLEYGCNTITLRLDKDGEVIGYQANCLCPRHPGDKVCSKEMSVQVAGSVDRCRRMLKLWILLGAGCKDREDHTDGHWKQTLLDLMNENAIPAETVLDDHAVHDPLLAFLEKVFSLPLSLPRFFFT
jgi:hypothetical protein